MQRHDLAYLTVEGWRCAVRSAAEANPALAAELCMEHPGIVRRQERYREGMVELGFSFPWYREGARTRARVAAIVPQIQITKTLTPFQVASLPDKAEQPCRGLLNGILAEGKRRGIEVGVYGSLAMQIATGWPYVTAQSDIDLYVRHGSLKELQQFYNWLTGVAEKAGVYADVEADVGNGYACKLNELLHGGSTVLCKGLRDARLKELGELRFSG